MQTIVLERPGLFSRVETAAPAPPEKGEAQVRVRRIGICGTDLHAFAGRQPFIEYPRILGHELGVEVVALGAEVASLSVGDKCAVEPYLSCGTCAACRRGKTNCCARLRVLGVHIDGGMRELINVPFGQLHKSMRLSLDQLVLVETLGIGAHAVDRAELAAGEQVLVIGAGPIGLAVIQFVLLAGGLVTVLDVRPDRLEFCRSLGVTSLVEAAGDPLPKLIELTGGDLFATVFDATGSGPSMAKSFEYVGHGGKLVFVGLFLGDVTFYDPHLHRREITLLASRNSTKRDFQRIIGLIEEGRIDTTPWITHRARLNEMIERFPSWLEPSSGVVKAVVEV